MDSKTETVSDNELIAQFMGFEKRAQGIWDNNEYAYTMKLPSVYNKLMIPSEMQFQTSWDWLMPVVRKIESLMPTIKIPEHLEQLKNGTHGSEPYVEVISLSIASPIEEVYKAVVEFIRWYRW